MVLVNRVARGQAASSARDILREALESGWVSKRGAVPSGISRADSFEDTLASDPSSVGKGDPPASFYAQEAFENGVSRFAKNLSSMERTDYENFLSCDLGGSRSTGRLETACFFAEVMAPYSPTDGEIEDEVLDLLMSESPPDEPAETLAGTKRAASVSPARKSAKVAEDGSPKRK